MSAVRVLWLSYVKPSVPDPIFIICEVRTGSTLLGDYLHSHPMVECKFEILNVGQVALLDLIRSKRDVRFYLHTIFKAIRNKVKCGKIHSAHFDQFGVKIDDLLSWFPGARFLVLYRGSLLEQFVSLKLAEETGRWIATRPGDETDRKVRVDVSELLAFARNTKRHYSELVRHPGLRGRQLAISYEELAHAAQETFDKKIWPFLCIPPHPVTSTMRKQNRRPVRDCISNVRDVAPLVGSGALENHVEGVALTLK